MNITITTQNGETIQADSLADAAKKAKQLVRAEKAIALAKHEAWRKAHLSAFRSLAVLAKRADSDHPNVALYTGDGKYSNVFTRCVKQTAPNRWELTFASLLACWPGKLPG